MERQRRKPPKHLPKDWPEGHELRGCMTPSEWIGQRLDNLFEDEWSAKNERIRAESSRHYDRYFSDLDERTRATIDRFLSTPQGRSLYRRYVQSFISGRGVRREDVAGLKAASAHAMAELRKAILTKEFSSESRREDHLDKVDEAIRDDLAGQALRDYDSWMEFEDTSPGRLVRGANKPQGVWPSVFERVRGEMKERFGIVLSDGKLKKCLDEYRALVLKLSL